MLVRRVCSLLQSELNIANDDRERMVTLGLYFENYFTRIDHIGLDWVYVYIYSIRISKKCADISLIDYEPPIYVPTSVFPGLIIQLFAMILTDKFHNDLTIPNTSWRIGLLRCLGVDIQTRDFNRLERFIFDILLDWDFMVSPEEYNSILNDKELYEINEELTCDDEKEFELTLSTRGPYTDLERENPI